MYKQTELVSVIIPSYGRPQYLSNSIQSVIEQNYESIELIVVDDNGRGKPMQIETESIVNQFKANFPIQYIVHELNRGGAAARNTGVAISTGKIIAFLDNDDLSLPTRISRQVDWLQKSHELDPTTKACICLPIRKKHNIEIDRTEPRDKKNYLFDLLALKVNLYTSCILLYKDVYQKLQGFDEAFSRNQDLEFMVRFYERYNAISLNEYLVIINIDDRSNIATYEKIKETKQLLFEKYISIIERFPSALQKEIYKNNYLEIAKIALWNKNIGGFLKAYRSAQLSLKETIVFIADGLRKAIIHLK